ncbi:MAG: GntR family transcriptional regulator [Acidobacteriota bacterium]|nr:GntR family transcriptional regulator [Acidobacteriota bacterium]
MDQKPVLNVKSLKSQVYEYLREQMRQGDILPGSVIDMEETSQKLGVSKTPLRDALLQLEMEHFVSILPRRKVVVNVLTVQDIRNYYQIIGALESTALMTGFDKIGAAEIEAMAELNAGMKEAVEQNDFDLYYERNLAFHNTFLNPCGNAYLIEMVNVLKKRLYDFPRQKGFVKEWEAASVGEHARLLEAIREGRSLDAANFIRDVHWSFEVQEKFIEKYYNHIPITES